jgi:hypothetical protein
MKKALIFAMSASVLVMLQRCNNEPEIEKPNASIAFLTNEPLPQNAALLLTLESSTGELLKEFEPVAFSATGDGYVTSNLDLQPGHYQVRDLVVVDKDGHMAFAAPKSDAPLSKGSGSGMITVGLHATKTSDHPIVLYSTAKYRPEDFGYEKFSAPSKIGLNVSVQLDDGDSKPDAGQALVLHNHDTIAQFELLPRINHLSFDAVAGGSYTILIFKDGYSSETRTISSADKVLKTIIAQLKRAFSMVTVTTSQGYTAFELDGWPGALTIDWGDGTSEPINLGDPNDVDVVRDHQYATAGKYYVNVTGALDQIHTLLFSQSEASATDRVNIEHLPKLYDLRFMYTQVAKSVDASQNHELAFYIFWNTDVEEIKISTVHPPFNIELEGSGNVTTASFEQMINDVYDNALRTGRTGGFISWLYFPNYPDFSTIAPVGSPSPATIEKMIILQNEYGWDFGPDADYDWGSGDPW